MYGIVYGGEGRADFVVDGPFASIEEARAAYDATRRIRYEDGLLGGASIEQIRIEETEDGRALCPVRHIETIADDAREEP